MQLKSHSSVPAPESWRIGLLVPLATGGAVLSGLALLARSLEQVVDAAWFGLEYSDLGGIGVLWVSLLWSLRS